MDRFTRNYTIALAVIALGLLVAWLSSLDFRAGELSDRLAGEPRLAAYPYRFKVVAVDGGTATLTTPRSPQVPAVRFLAILHPELAGKGTNDPAVVAAQRELGEVQGLARKRVLAESGIERVRWEVDRQWYHEHGVMLP
ncbi:hypothetical protein [Endothiovibrio diazotrophicus]